MTPRMRDYVETLRGGTIGDVIELSDFFAESEGKMKPFSRALRDVIECLNESGLRYSVIGGIAAGERGQARTTKDIDIAVTSARGISAALDPVSEKVRPFLPIGGGDTMAKFLHDETGTVIDVLILRSAAGQAAVREATPATIGRSLVAPIAPAEALICLKLVACLSPGREPPKRRQDEVDVQQILLRQGGALARDRLDALLDALPAALRRRARAKLRELDRELPHS